MGLLWLLLLDGHGLHVGDGLGLEFLVGDRLHLIDGLDLLVGDRLHLVDGLDLDVGDGLDLFVGDGLGLEFLIGDRLHLIDGLELRVGERVHLLDGREFLLGNGLGFLLCNGLDCSDGVELGHKGSLVLGHKVGLDFGHKVGHCLEVGHSLEVCNCLIDDVGNRLDLDVGDRLGLRDRLGRLSDINSRSLGHWRLRDRNGFVLEIGNGLGLVHRLVDGHGRGSIFMAIIAIIGSSSWLRDRVTMNQTIRASQRAHPSAHQGTHLKLKRPTENKLTNEGYMVG